MNGPPCDQISLPNAGDCTSWLSPQTHPGRCKSSLLPAVHSAVATEDDGGSEGRAGRVVRMDFCPASLGSRFWKG